LKLVHLLIISISILFLIYALHSYISYDFAIKEVKNSAGLRNQAQALNIIRDLDKYIDNRIDGFSDLATMNQIRQAVLISNQEYEGSTGFQTPNVTSSIPDKSSASRQAYESIFEEIRYLVEFYKKEYNYDVINELFITNQYGVHIIDDKSEFRYDNEIWWQATQKKQTFIGDFVYDENYDTYSLMIAYPILDDGGNFIGSMRIAVNINDLLHDFLIDADILAESKKNVILLDRSGNIIYEKNHYYPNRSAPYFDLLVGSSGTIEYEDDTRKLISYASSIGHKDFAGFDWTVVVEREEAVILSEFVDLRNNVILSTIIAIVSAVTLSLLLSHFVTNPLGQMSRFAARLGKGDFDTKLRESKISEINSIVESFNNMEASLKKLFATEKELAETKARVKNERLTAIGELAASMAHDMKNPLGTIKSGIDIIKRNVKSDENLDEILKRVDRAISRMSHQVEDVLNYVRFTPLDVKPVKALNLLQSAIKTVDVPKTIAVEITGKDVDLVCDEKKMEIVFINLILNAVQAIGEGSGKIILNVGDDENNVVIKVQDSGSGVPKEISSDIFKPLVTTKQKGTGLGLASCKNIVEQHGGSISFSNNPTVFIVTLPKNLST
jgi:signal transduction histidine kinase